MRGSNVIRGEGGVQGGDRKLSGDVQVTCWIIIKVCVYLNLNICQSMNKEKLIKQFWPLMNPDDPWASDLLFN